MCGVGWLLYGLGGEDDPVRALRYLWPRVPVQHAQSGGSAVRVVTQCRGARCVLEPAPEDGTVLG